MLRNVFRLVEYAAGGINGNDMTRHEWSQYVFDAVSMFFAVVALEFGYPGKVPNGERSDFSEEGLPRKSEIEECQKTGTS